MSATSSRIEPRPSESWLRSTDRLRPVGCFTRTVRSAWRMPSWPGCLTRCQQCLPKTPRTRRLPLAREETQSLSLSRVGEVCSSCSTRPHLQRESTAPRHNWAQALGFSCCLVSPPTEALKTPLFSNQNKPKASEFCDYWTLLKYSFCRPRRVHNDVST